MSDRLAVARDYVAKKPTDRFGLYTLAMEYRKVKDYTQSVATFRTLLEHHPLYGAGWYHLAMTLKESGDRAACVAALKQGLDATEKSKDAKTQAEIEGVLDELGEL